MSETKKKVSFLSKKVSLKKGPVKYPDKKTMNFIVDEQKQQNKNALVLFGLFLILLACFTKFFVLDPLAKVSRMQNEYQKLQNEIVELQKVSADFKDVKAKYDTLTGAFMNKDEQNNQNRAAIYKMIEEDITPYVGVSGVTINNNTVTVETDLTSLQVISGVITTLQADERNGYVTVTTTSNSSDQNSDQVKGSISITVKSAFSESTGGQN